MAKWPLVGYDGVTRENGPDGFHAFGGVRFHDTDEAVTQQEVRDTYTASNLRVYISAFVGDAGADDVIMVFRLNGGDGNGTVTVNGTGEFEDASNTDSLVSGDLICMESEDAAQGHDDSWTTETFQVTLDASSDVPTIVGAGLWSISGVEFAALQGGLDDRGTETDVEYTMRATRTLSELRLYASAHSSDVVITMRKNQADGNLTVTVNAANTEFLDTTNSDSYVAGDEANYGSGTGAVSINVHSVEANTSSGLVTYADTSTGAGTEFFIPGHNTAVTATEAEAQVEAEDAATIQNLFVNCFFNAETRTIRSRKNAANGNLSVSVTGTGFFEDTSNTDSLVAEDDLSIQHDSGASATNAYLVAVEWETSTGVSTTITGVVAEADAAAVVGTVTSVGVVSVTGVVATADAAAVVGAVHIGISVAGAVAEATAAALAGTVTSVGIVNVAGEVATADAAAVAATVTSVQIVSVAGAVATADAAAVAGAVEISATIAGAVAAADAAAVPATVTSVQIVLVTGAVSTADAAAVSGTVTSVGIVSVSGEVAAADAAAVIATITSIQIVSVTGAVATADAAALPGVITAIVGGAATRRNSLTLMGVT